MISAVTNQFAFWANARRSPAAIERLRVAKLRRLLAHCEAHVPWYRDLMREAGVRPDDIRSTADLAALPVTDKATLQALPVEARLSAAFARDRLQHLRTSGSTARPFDIYRDRGSNLMRKGAFVRCLFAAGYRPPMRLLGTRHEPKNAPRGLLNWTYVSNTIEPQDFAAALKETRPHIVYGSVTPLRQLAAWLGERGEPMPRVRAVVATAERLDEHSDALLRQHLADETFEIYGTTETGALAWSCSAHDGLHIAEDSNIIELVPRADRPLPSVVVTNLDLLAMPVLRYEVGDMAEAGPEGPCPCGCRFRRMGRVRGRIFETLTMPDGTELSPMAATDAMELVPNVARYQIIQDAVGRFTAKVQPQVMAEGIDTDEVRRQLARHVGEDAAITVAVEADLEPPMGRKFRVVENRLRGAARPDAG